MVELSRFLRHAFAPIVVYLVERGLLPEWAQKDVLEALVIGAAFVIPYGISWLRDKQK